MLYSFNISFVFSTIIITNSLYFQDSISIHSTIHMSSTYYNYIYKTKIIIMNTLMYYYNVKRIKIVDLMISSNNYAGNNAVLNIGAKGRSTFNLLAPALLYHNGRTFFW